MPRNESNLAKLNYGQPKPSLFLRFPVRFIFKKKWGGGAKNYKMFSPFQAMLTNFDFYHYHFFKYPIFVWVLPKI